MKRRLPGWNTDYLNGFNEGGSNPCPQLPSNRTGPELPLPPWPSSTPPPLAVSLAPPATYSARLSRTIPGAPTPSAAARPIRKEGGGGLPGPPHPGTAQGVDRAGGHYRRNPVPTGRQGWQSRGASSRSEVFAASSRPAPPALRAECRATRCRSAAPSRWPLGAPRWSRCSGTVVGSLLKCLAFTPATRRPAAGRPPGCATRRDRGPVGFGGRYWVHAAAQGRG